jgi:hypothetical protein
VSHPRPPEARSRRNHAAGAEPKKCVVGDVFLGVTNRMESGYLLRPIAEQINGTHFDSTDEIHTLGHLYESLLKEVRDSAGDSGEFYTPRAMVRFLVEASASSGCCRRKARLTTHWMVGIAGELDALLPSVLNTAFAGEL